MPVFFQHQINGEARLGIWKIEESEEYFKDNVPLHRQVTHPQKRLQHLAGRFLLRYLYPDFPYELIEIADTRKPFLPNEAYHFSISHCGDYAAAIVSPGHRVGIDIEAPVEKILRISEKFLTSGEKSLDSIYPLPLRTTLLWSAKESIFKWYGEGNVDFRRDINIDRFSDTNVDLQFRSQRFKVPFRIFENVVLTYIVR